MFIISLNRKIKSDFLIFPLCLFLFVNIGVIKLLTAEPDLTQCMFLKIRNTTTPLHLCIIYGRDQATMIVTQL